MQNLQSQEDTWSPTSSKKTLRMFLASASKCNFKVKQLDYIGAFLQAPVRSKIFVPLPAEYLEIYPEYAQYFGRPLKLLKSCYGMIFSKKWWFIVLQEYLVSEQGGFKQAECDNALFIKKENDGSLTKMLVYIDDSLYFNTKENQQLIQKFEDELQSCFKVQLQCDAHRFLSMRITRNQNGNYTIDQSRYTKSIVKKFLGVTNAKVTNRPLPSEWEASKSQESRNDDEIKA